MSTACVLYLEEALDHPIQHVPFSLATHTYRANQELARAGLLFRGVPKQHYTSAQRI